MVRRLVDDALGLLGLEERAGLDLIMRLAGLFLGFGNRR
jgi:hypothetical protein